MADEYDEATGLHVRRMQPGWEDILFDIDLAPRMRTSDTIAAVNSVGFTNMGTVTGSGDITLGANAYSGTIAQVRISASSATSGERYKVTFRCTTVAGDKIEGDGMLYVDNL